MVRGYWYTRPFPLILSCVAWPVSFNLPLTSFLGVLQATRNLVDLALSSPYVDAPKVMFISSIGVLRRTFVYAMQASQVFHY